MSLKVIRNGTIQNLGYGFLFTFHGNSGSILYHFRDKARYWSKIAIYHTFCIRRPGYEDCRRKSPYTVWCGKTWIRWLPDGEKFEDTFSRCDTIPACDGQTDGQTSCDGIVRATHRIAQKKRSYGIKLLCVRIIAYNCGTQYTGCFKKVALKAP